jgi:hypothetical protein
MGIDHVVTDGVLLHRQLALEIEVLDVLLPLFRDGCLLGSFVFVRSQVCR